MSINPPVRRTRAERIRKLKEMVMKSKSTLELEEILAKFALEEGVSMRTVKEYLDLLEKAGEITLNV